MDDIAPPSSARDRILSTAHALFYRHGIRATGIDRIIQESGVAKLTFYRHFPSKNALICAYLDDRHELWMTWFISALDRYATTPQAWPQTIVKALAEWFESGDYRGCAFINAVVEVHEDIPEVAEISRRHKADMVDALARLMLPGPARGKEQLAAMAIDGAIVRAQMGDTSTATLKALRKILESL